MTDIADMALFRKKQEKRRKRVSPVLHDDASKRKRTPLKSGTVVGQYLIEGVIGGGGYSIVYRCFDTLENQNVVLKEYCPNQLSFRDENGSIQPMTEKQTRPFQVGMHQFFAEAHSLSKIQHPHIINIINVFRENNTAYMVSMFETGRDLRWFIKRCPGDLDQAFVQKALPPIMSGIHALHQNKLLHLDIKPANIFLRADGGPLLLDFGAAKLMDKKERFTSFQTLTPGYAPPEQHQKDQLGPGSDIYALGATIYSCITGHPPPTSLNRDQKNDELDLRGAEKRIPQSVIDVIRWALEMDISKRPQSIPDFADLFLRDTEWSSFAEYNQHLMSQHPDLKNR